MIGFFDEIPREIDESAMVDGLTRPLVLLRVLLPLARPGMLVAATFGVIFVWNEFLVGLYIVNSTDKETIPIAASVMVTETLAGGPRRTAWSSASRVIW